MKSFGKNKFAARSYANTLGSFKIIHEDDFLLHHIVKHADRSKSTQPISIKFKLE